jgi:hypothetical protein
MLSLPNISQNPPFLADLPVVWSRSADWQNGGTGTEGPALEPWMTLRRCCASSSAAWDFPSAARGVFSASSPHPNRPRARWDFHCNLRPGPSHVLADVSFIPPLAASYLRSAARTPGHAAALRDADKRRDYYADHACLGYEFRALSFEHLRQFSPGTMQILSEATHAVFPQPGHQREASFANVYRQLSVVQCRYLSRMLTAAVGLHTARTGSDWIRGAPQATPELLH